MPSDAFGDPGQSAFFLVVDLSDWPGIPGIQDALFVDAMFSAIGPITYTLEQEDFRPLNRPRISMTTGETFDSITLTRGVVRAGSDLMSWMQHGAYGDRKFLGGGYRKTIGIYQLQPGAQVSKTLAEGNEFQWKITLPVSEEQVIRAWSLFDCKAGRYQAASGWDALSGEIVTAQLDIIPGDLIEWGGTGAGLIGTAISLGQQINKAAG